MEEFIIGLVVTSVISFSNIQDVDAAKNFTVGNSIMNS